MYRIKASMVKDTRFAKSMFSKAKIQSSTDIYRIATKLYLRGTLNLREEFHVLYLNNAGYCIGSTIAGVGDLNSTVIDIKLIIYLALECRAASIILIHNHPSGNLKPSKADDRMTKKIQDAARYFDLNVLDHLILTKEDYYSYADDGKLT